MPKRQQGKTRVPNAETILRLQEQYSKAVRARGLPPEIEAKLTRMQTVKALSGEANSEERSAASEAAAESRPTPISRSTIWTGTRATLNVGLRAVRWFGES